MPPWFLVWFFLLAINLASFSAFGIDKNRARTDAWRIREKDLLFLALIGGTGGAYLGRWYFRHKTRKSGFSTALHLTALAQFVLIGWVFMPP